MVKSYYSTVFEQTADQVWGVIRDFGNDFWWTSEPVETLVEEGKSGDTVGAIRHVHGAGLEFRQRLLALSDWERFFTYEFCDPNARAVHNMEVTLRVTPIIDGNRAFVEWSATFDCDPSEYARWAEHFRKSFARWLEALRSHLANERERIRQNLLGVWQLVSWEGRDAAGNTTYPLGPDVIGQIAYDASGRMSAQLVRPHQARFASEDWQVATAEEKAAAWGNYFGYFGTYTLNEQARAITHHIEGSWFPNLVGTKQVRYYHFEGSQLVLDADTEWGQVRIVWKKVQQ